MILKYFSQPKNSFVLIVVLIATLITTGLYFYYGNSNKKGYEVSSVPIEVELARKGSLTREIEVVGTLVANNMVVVRAGVRGNIAQVLTKGGEEVEKGRVLFEIDDRPFKSRVKEAQALLTPAQEAAKRIGQLSDKKFASAKMVQETQAALLKAEAQLEVAQKELEDTKIIAPYEGVVGIHKIGVGALVGPDVELVTITDVDPMKIDFKVPARYLNFINKGQQIKIYVDNLPDQEFTGEIEAIDGAVDPSTQNITARATIDNSKRLLKPGSFAKVRVVVGSNDDALIISEDALESTSEQDYVYKVIEHPQKPGVYVAFRVPVSIGLSYKGRLEVKRGLEDGDIVVQAGQNRFEGIKDGIPVTFDLEAAGLIKKKPAKQAPKKEPSKKMPSQSDEEKK